MKLKEDVLRCPRPNGGLLVVFAIQIGYAIFALFCLFLIVTLSVRERKEQETRALGRKRAQVRYTPNRSNLLRETCPTFPRFGL